MKIPSNVTENKSIIPMSIQLLAGEGEPAGEPTDNPVDDNKGQEPGQEPEVKMYTQEEINSIVEKRMARFQAKMETEKKQAEELAKLSEADRQKKMFEIQVAEFEAQKAEWEKSQLQNETREQLKSRELLSDFDEFILGADAESTLERLNRFETLIAKTVELEVAKRLKGKAPKAPGSTITAGEMTREQFKGLNVAERAELYKDNPELFNKLK